MGKGIAPKRESIEGTRRRQENPVWNPAAPDSSPDFPAWRRNPFGFTELVSSGPVRQNRTGSGGAPEVPAQNPAAPDPPPEKSGLRRIPQAWAKLPGNPAGIPAAPGFQPNSSAQNPAAPDLSPKTR